MEPQKRPQGQGVGPEGFLAQPSTPRQAFRNWTHGMAAHYSMAFGHGARWTDSYTLATGRHPHLPWEPWQLTPRGPRHSQGASRQCSFPGWQGMRKERLWRTKMPGCWAPRNNRSLLDSVFLPPFFKHLALSLSRNKIATRNVHKYLVCLESPVSVTALLGSFFRIFKVTKSLLLCLQWGLCRYSEHPLSLHSPFSSNPSNCPSSLPISSGLRQGGGRGGLGHLLL